MDRHRGRRRVDGPSRAVRQPPAGPGRAQAAAVVEAQQGAFERHRHLRLDQAGLRERCFRLGRLGRLASGHGQIATAAGQCQGRRRKAAGRNGALELNECGLGVAEPAKPISASASRPRQLKMPGRPPTPRRPGCAHRFCREEYPARSPRAKASEALATAAVATARTTGNRSAAAWAALTCACAAGHWPRKARTWAMRACARARSSGRSVSCASEMAS